MNLFSFLGLNPFSSKHLLPFIISVVAQAALLTVAQATIPQPPSKVCLDNTSDDASKNCITNETVAKGSIKWHPGHYLAVFKSRLNFNWNPPGGAPTKIKGNPNFKGLLMIWDWSELEPSKGNYDFSEIFANLNEIRTWDPAPKMILNIQYRDFRTLQPESIPAYMLDLEPSGVVIRDDDKQRVVLALWRDNVQHHLKQMITALSRAVNPKTGQTLDQDPLFGGIGFPETALGLRKTDAPDLDKPNDTPPEKANFVLGLKNVLLHTQAAFPQSLVWQKANWLQNSDEYMQHFVDWAANAGIGISGPDFSFAGDITDAEKAVYPGLKGARDLRDKLPLAREDQNSNMKNHLLCKGETVASIFDWLINDAAGPQLNYVFWGRLDNINACGNYWSFNKKSLPSNQRIKQIIEKKNAQANKALPSSLQ